MAGLGAGAAAQARRRPGGGGDERRDGPDPGRLRRPRAAARALRGAAGHALLADDNGVLVRVYGRTTDWGDGGPIPGGMAYENFELEVPFAQGASCGSVCLRKGRRS